MFYVNLPIGVAVVALLVRTFPSLRHPGSKPRIDWSGAGLIGGGAALLTLGASLQGTNGWGYPPVGFSLAVGAALLIVAFFHERRTPEAVLPIELFRSSIFSLTIGVTFLLGAVMFGTITYIPLFLQGVIGVHATNSGLLLLPLMAGLVVASVAGGQVLTRTGRYRTQAVIGISLVAVGIFLATLLNASSTQGHVTPSMIALGLGLGLSMPVFNVVAQNAVPARLMSSSTSAVQFIRQMGATMGLAVMGSVFNARLVVHGGRGAIAIAGAIHDVFLLALAGSIFTVILAACIREIPLRTTSGADDRARAASLTPIAEAGSAER